MLPLILAIPCYGAAYQVFQEALQLLQKYYYNPRQIINTLPPRTIEYCRKHISLDPYEPVRCLVKRVRDPYTKFLTPEESKKELRRIKTITTGFGILLDAFNPRIIGDVQKDSPAFKAGIKAKDRIIAINGIPVEYLSEDEINQYLNDPSFSTRVNLDLKREPMFFTATLSVEELKIVPIRTKILPGNFAYIKIDDLLSDNAENELRRAIGTKAILNSYGLILDLRGNKGGLLSNAINISDDLLDGGIIVITKSYSGQREVHAKPGIIYNKPIAVLIDGKTASASEVIAAALRDNGRAILIGTKSFGKGLVQQIKPLSDGSALHITVNKFFTPKGAEINRVGILPNNFVKEPNAQINEAISYLKRASKK